MSSSKSGAATGETSGLEAGTGATDIEAVVSLGRCLPSPAVATLAQKLMAEIIGTYFVIFAGCGSVVANKIYDEKLTFPGICITWGAIVAAMIYSVGHISGAHFNPAVTITSTVLGRFSFKEMPLYIIAQLLGSILASGTLALMFDVTPDRFFGTTPSGSTMQSFTIEIVITFLLMFTISSTTTDSRAVGNLAGGVIGLVIMLNVLVAGKVSGASMNPARSIGPALVKGIYKGIWAYIVGPIIGALLGAFAYNFIRTSEPPKSNE